MTTSQITTSTLCTICRDTLSGNESQEVTLHSPDHAGQEPHRFHRECITPWVAEHPRCPLCNQEVTKEVRGVLFQPQLVTAAEHGALLDVNRLLAAATFSDKARGEALRKATLNGRATIVNRLLAAGGSISAEDRGLAVQGAAFYGRPDIVIQLLHSGPISEEARGITLQGVAFHGCEDIVTELLQSVLFFDAERFLHHLGNAVANAASSGHLPVVKQLLAVGRIPDVDRGSAVICAASNGHLEIVQLLLDNGTISNETLDDAVKRAASKGHLLIVKQLAGRGPISETARRQAIRNANDHGHTEIAEFLDQSRSKP